MLKTMEKLMEILVVGDRNPVAQQQETQIRNPNFKRPQFPQIRQRDQRNPIDQQIRPPFQENVITEDVEDNKYHINCFDKNEPKFYLTKEEHDNSYQELNDDSLTAENMDYQRGYQNAILEFQKQYNLRNRNVIANPQKIQANQPSTGQKKRDAVKGDMPKSDDHKT